ncbi:DUF3027 domain-containing protein [Streptomyces sp. ST2-7A]|uniref:DUF3027 domain-containing protein n=1 Tax=Streptomyces sp. ST2-7A TaxID=2907214 RepID=UPI001F36B379|nr:DUF3027 domain-containing protein [Streptomyces sp. ST2-7A]MCE7079076.1 DUF3027 domain-containing protein [Streptomyces sp. ST2-7A]
MRVGTRSRTPDRLCAEAVELAREVAEEVAAPRGTGPHLGVVHEGDRLVTHRFECLDPGYRGWYWGVTVARASRARYVTVDEVALLPGPDALLAPEWVPWSERLRAGDLGPGDLLPVEADDPRLASGGSGLGEAIAPPVPDADAERAGEPEGSDGTSGPTGADAPTGDDSVADGDGESLGGEPLGGDPGEPGEAGGAEDAHLVEPPERARIEAVARELGFGRARVLSRLGIEESAERWQEAFGPETPMAQAAPASCAGCGFLIPMAGSLRQAFGVCANEYSPADGRVVSLDYGCGAHSEAARMPDSITPPPPVIDHLGADPL